MKRSTSVFSRYRSPCLECIVLFVALSAVVSGYEDLEANRKLFKLPESKLRGPNETLGFRIFNKFDYSTGYEADTLRSSEDSDGNSISNYRSQLTDQPKRGVEATDDQERAEVRAGSSVGAIESLDMTVKTGSENASMKLTEFSEELVTRADRNIIEEKKMLIEVNRNSNLLAAPGTIHRVTFDVTNGCVLPVIYAFRAKSSPFRVYNVKPISAWVYPEQVANVAIDLVVPNNAAPDTADTVSLYILGTEIKEKSAYVYVQGSLSKLTDDAKPVVGYSYNGNCAGKLDKDRCYKSRWSVDLTIQDYDSGLKRVLSSPNDIYPRTEFISGTRSPVTFYYSATCCDKAVKITAIDLLNNYNTVTIDVTAWNNLSEAEIAAITAGALLALLFIILIVALIVYCVRRRKSRDLPYTQRYGSTGPPPAQSERF